MTQATPTKSHTALDRLSAAGVLVALGIVYGDLGTSPLYTLSAIIRGAPISELLVLGSVSCIFWTLTFQATLKYIFITLRADNHGEGGIFALYTLIRKQKAWLFFPAIAGGGFLLADGIITPPISVSSAIEGLRIPLPNIETLPIVLIILGLLFLSQQFGTEKIGRVFGPVMLLWFLMIGVLGAAALSHNWGVLRALSPTYVVQFLVHYPRGFWLLGGVFLCCTGAEALYADMGHCGRQNIRVSWIFVKITLVLSYFGQAAYLMGHIGERLENVSPFYALTPNWFLLPCIGVATLATIIASQALITGSFTLVNEAMRLNLWPILRIRYPSEQRGQLYVPAVNLALWVGCSLVVLHFRESSAMEAAFGLAVTLTMLSTTLLLTYYLIQSKWPRPLVVLITTGYCLIEGSFLIANLMKIREGGWVSLTLGSVLLGIMWIWHTGRQIQERLTASVKLADQLPILIELSNDKTVPKFATHLVYISEQEAPELIDRQIIFSILNRQPKRADVYWFIHVEVVDEPYRMSYEALTLAKDDVVFVHFKLGFRIEPRINLMFRQVVQQMVACGEVNIMSRYESLGRNQITGDFHFVLFSSFLSHDNQLSTLDKLVMQLYFLIARISLKEDEAYGLDANTVTIEKVPLVITKPHDLALVREG